MSRARVGDLIRSYDFEGNDRCYVEGRVTKVDGMYVYGDVIRQIWDGELVETEPGETWRCIQNGTKSWTGGYTNFITVLLREVPA
jgi:hypothetical protein